jgi:hypothetical protein
MGLWLADGSRVSNGWVGKARGVCDDLLKGIQKLVLMCLPIDSGGGGLAVKMPSAKIMAGLFLNKQQCLP